MRDRGNSDDGDTVLATEADADGRALARAGGNISEVARLLGTHRNRIYRALAEQEHAKG